MAAKTKAKAKGTGKATKAKPAKDAPAAAAPVEAVEAVEAVEVPEDTRLTAQDREAVAVSVLDLTLLLLQRRLRDNPDAVQASGIAEVTKLLGLFWRFKDKLGDGYQDQADLTALLQGLPSYADDDPDDPLLQGHNRDHDPTPAVSPADIAALAKFDD